MSSEDDFGSYDPTTPFKPAVTQKKVARASRPKAVAGPSSKPAAKGARRNASKKSPEASDIEEIHEVSEPVEISSERDEEEGVVTVVPPAKRRKGETNGKVVQKGKEKAAGTGRKAAASPHAALIEVVEDTSEETLVGSKKPTGSMAHSKDASKEMERLRQRLADTEAQRDALSKQLEESLSIRRSEPEVALEVQKEHYEAIARTQESLIKELTSQLARVNSLAGSGATPLLHFLTREAANEEKKSVEKEVLNWKEVAKEKESIICQKNDRIAKLEQLEKELRHEIKLEVERSKSLATKTARAPPTPRGGSRWARDDPKETSVIKFYEDLTNLLVTNMKFEPGKYSKFIQSEDVSFTCVYSFPAVAEDDEDPGQKSLSFALRLYHDISNPNDPEPVTSAEQLTEIVKFIPLDLDKESPEFVQSLDFLREPFTFGKSQLHLFIHSLQKTLGDAASQSEVGRDNDMDE